jgi:hypothetical protein
VVNASGTSGRPAKITATPTTKKYMTSETVPKIVAVRMRFMI